MMPSELIKRYANPVPRYTSYPTANHFSPAVGVEQYRSWLTELKDGSELSIYLHVPFCNELCWYCGCTTKAAQRYEPVAGYVDTLLAELHNVAGLMSRGHVVRSIHWGGGSPSMLAPDDIRRIDATMRALFRVAADADYAVEIDPRNIDAAKVKAFAEAGINRISLGVQDFDPAVQTAINRIQSFDLTRGVVEQFRAAGIPSINIDLVYGLPHQTRRSVTETILKLLELRPDRIAIFGYAHIPSRIKHQRLINEAALPDVVERFGQSNRLARMVTSAGYLQVGLDHFALPSDDMGQKSVRRNFQGYTTDRADALLGFGASAIGHFPQGYVQNAAAVHDYAERVAREGLATVRGITLTSEDRVRAAVIEKLMCDFEFSCSALRDNFGAAAAPVLEEAESLIECDADGIVAEDHGVFKITERGRPFVRTICSCFDSYLGTSKASHAVAV